MLTVAVCGVPAVAAMEAGAPALLVSANPGLVVRAAPVAVTVYLPAVSLAVNTGEVANPALLVIAVFPEQAKVPLAPLVGALKVTSTPDTGSPEESFTVAARALAKALATVALCGVPLVAAMVAGTCGSLIVRMTGTVCDIACEKYWTKVIWPV